MTNQEAYLISTARVLVEGTVRGGGGRVALLRQIAATHSGVAAMTSSTAGLIAETIAAAVSLAADLAAAGRDPVQEIERIRAVDPLLADMRSRWAERKRKKLEGD